MLLGLVLSADLLTCKIQSCVSSYRCVLPEYQTLFDRTLSLAEKKEIKVEKFTPLGNHYRSLQIEPEAAGCPKSCCKGQKPVTAGDCCTDQSIETHTKNCLRHQLLEQAVSHLPQLVVSHPAPDCTLTASPMQDVCYHIIRPLHLCFLYSCDVVLCKPRTSWLSGTVQSMLGAAQDKACLGHS